MAERMPGHNNSGSTKSDSNSEQMSNNPTKSSGTSQDSSKSESSDNSTTHSSLVNGTKSTQTERAEWVVQDEPGVYITLSSFPGGGNELKRVRFSRKRFMEQQAEKWLAENGAKVCERHNIQIAE